MLTPDEAWRRLEEHLSPLAGSRLPRREAVGRALAEAVHSTVDIPACDVSAMDGYAIAASVDRGDSLPVVATAAAGDPPGLSLAVGQAARIMTGAPVPLGTRAVVPVEETDGGTEVVEFRTASRDGSHIRRGGEIVRAGDPILDAGAILTPGTLSLLASHGHRSVTVHRPPTVAFVSTGNEVVPPDAEPGPGQLRDSHTDFLTGAVAGLGLELRGLGIARDSADSLQPLLQKGLDADVLLVSGGVSMGEFDIVEEVLAELGCTVIFDRVAVQPGKPLVAAAHPGGLIFGLPGNPASVMVCFWLFVRPALRRLMGRRDGFWQGALTATLAAPLPGAKQRDRFLPAEVESTEGHILAHPLAPKGSHDVMAYAHGAALVRIPASSPPAAAGTPCQLLPLVDWPERPTPRS